MKITYTKHPGQPKPSYPFVGRLRIDGSFAVLFVSEGTGVVVDCTDDTYDIGEFSRIWNEELFVRETATITFNVEA